MCHRRQEAGLDLRGVIDARGHAVGQQLEQEGFLACGRVFDQLDQFGHLLGAAGAIEAIFCILAIRDQIAPPTINLDNPERETALKLVRDKGQPMEIDVAMSNSIGFGGTNASVIFRKIG